MHTQPQPGWESAEPIFNKYIQSLDAYGRRMFIRSADPKGSPCASDGTLGPVRPFYDADRPAVRAGIMKTVYGFPLPDNPRGKEIYMATKYYIEDKNGTILSEDGTRKFIVLEGQKLHDYLQTEEGKQKRFFVYEDNGEVIGIEEMPNTTKGETPEERRVRYQKKVKAEMKPNEISLDDLVEIEGGDLILLHEIVPDESEDTEGKAVLQVSLEELRVARRCLTDEENRLLDLVFTDTHTRTAEEVGKLLGRTQQSVDEKVKRILGYLYIELKRRRRW